MISGFEAANRWRRRRFALPISNMDLIFVMFVAFTAVFSVVVAKSDRFTSLLYHGVNSTTVPISTDAYGAVTSYHTGASCVPSRFDEKCDATVHINYVFTGIELLDYAAILVDQFSGDLSIFLNGELKYATQSQSLMLRLLPQRPVMIEFPYDDLKLGANRVEIRVRSHAILGGFIGRISIGPGQLLNGIYERSLFLIYTVPTLFTGMLLLIGIITLYLGVRHSQSNFLLCALISVSFSVPMIYDILPFEKPLILLGYIRLLRIIPGAYAMAFICRVWGLPYPISILALTTFPLALFATFSISSSRYESGVSIMIFWIFLIMVLIHGIIILVLQLRKSQKSISFVMLVLSALGLIGMCINFAQVTGISDDIANVLRIYTPVLFVIIISSYVIVDFSNKAIRIKLANLTMSEEIARVTRTLNEASLRAEADRRTLLIQSERQRLMGDLHDGLAGNLITIQALSDDTGSNAACQIHELARNALLDLRLVVESLDSFDGDLAAVVAAFQERIMPQYRQARAHFHWDFRDAPKFANLSPETNLGIFRILQEAIANAVRHGAASNIYIVARAMKGDPKTALIFVCDDGRPILPVAPGFGMRNMSRRALSIGGNLRFHFSQRGTTVLLRFGNGSRRV
jgi:signal transduction histidine kinase